MVFIFSGTSGPKEIAVRYLSSAIGRKQIMGITGLVWSGFVLMHMAGNLLIVAGPNVYNKYGHAIVSNPLLYVAEVLLLVALIAHVIDGVLVTIKNKAARPQKYSMPTNGAKSARFQSKWMIFHGSLILVFIILHLITFKYGPGIYEGYTTTIDGVQMRDLYRLITEVFKSPGYLVWYTIAMVVVGLHLSHGLYSSFASLGIYHPKLSPVLSKFGYVYALIVALGFIVPPIYVFFAL
jgi:succinate dehydrogenase / fumarate reductase cytochrome b subunit